MMNWDEKYLEESLKLHIGLELNPLCIVYHHYNPSMCFLKSNIFPELDLTNFKKYTCVLIDNIIEDYYKNELKSSYKHNNIIINVINDINLKYPCIKIKDNTSNIVFDLYTNNNLDINSFITIFSIDHLMLSNSLYKYKDVKHLLDTNYYVDFLQTFYINNFSKEFNIITFDSNVLIKNIKETDFWRSYVYNKNIEEKDIIEFILPQIIKYTTKWVK